ncbi:tyrosine-type recombinase/integrase [Sphingomonas abietis]|uniref:Tyrosine-type recombinase/integrase n=1 Tax=Sphingomonas abietis TaxID=3012344 RepID=A0ABY7NNF3_9SPHN|nr:tyrosine-type recombinase/integrase [Sphingomonas abietis]WBO22505.1 tyrosine-type recombinase/integrase [Sphingomonas abietis]
MLKLESELAVTDVSLNERDMPELKRFPCFGEVYRIVMGYIPKEGAQRGLEQQVLIDEFIKTTNSTGSLLSYRATIKHLLRYLHARNIKLDRLSPKILETFKGHACTAECLPSRTFSNRQTPALFRFWLFLQYQSVVPATGWDAEDPKICFSFLHNLIKEGVHSTVADVQAKNALHFLLWSRLKGVPRPRIGEFAEAFIRHECSCGLQTKSGRLDGKAKGRRQIAVDRFLRFISGENPVFRDGIFFQRRKRCQPFPSVLRYREYLTRQRGLRPHTIQHYTLDIMSWLPKLGEDASTYTAGAIRDMAMVEFAKRGTSMQSRLIRSARSYLLFRASEGHCSHSLAQALVSRPTYRLSRVPRRLDVDAVQRVIDSCDVSTRRGLRDRAVLLLLAELGLRAAEVWRLKLQDLDWAEAKLRIEGKGGRGAVVPLTQRSGDAVLDYIEKARPCTPSDALFVRLSRPHTPFAKSAEIASIARMRLSQCGYRGGSHIFRHTLATELLRDGRSLEDVATVLRHRSVATTTIYAKVNEPMLKRLAEPWMGDRS